MAVLSLEKSQGCIWFPWVCSPMGDWLCLCRWTRLQCWHRAVKSGEKCLWSHPHCRVHQKLGCSPNQWNEPDLSLTSHLAYSKGLVFTIYSWYLLILIPSRCYSKVPDQICDIEGSNMSYDFEKRLNWCESTLYLQQDLISWKQQRQF